jgi:hypothetical protein
MQVDILVPDWGDLEDHCEAVLSITVSSANVGDEIDGIFNCTWDGSMQSYEVQFGGGIIRGGWRDEQMTGTAHYGPITSEWVGEIGPAITEMSGSWSTVQPASEADGLPEVTHSGSFQATKD